MKSLIIYFILFCISLQTQARDWQLMFSNTWRLAYQRNPDPGQPRPLIWLYEYEPVLGISTHNWDVGVKGRMKHDGSMVPYQKIDGYGYGLYARWKPVEKLQKVEDKFCKEMGKILMRNAFVSASIERSNLFLDSASVATTKDHRLNNVIFSPAIGTLFKATKWFQLEVDYRWGYYWNENGLRAFWKPLNGQLNLRFTFLI